VIYVVILRSQLERQLAASYALEAAPENCVVSFRENTRSPAQNALLWARLNQLSHALKWHGETLTPSEWKDLLSASLRQQKVVRGVNGGLVFLGARTSQMSVAEMNDLLALIDALAAERGIVWTERNSTQAGR
jgi:beta-xylosidase